MPRDAQLHLNRPKFEEILSLRVRDFIMESSDLDEDSGPDKGDGGLSKGFDNECPPRTRRAAHHREIDP